MVVTLHTSPHLRGFVGNSFVGDGKDFAHWSSPSKRTRLLVVAHANPHSSDQTEAAELLRQSQSDGKLSLAALDAG